MRFNIVESKLDNALESYFNSNDKLSNLRYVDSWNGLATNYFPSHENYEEDEYTSDYSFAYFPDLDSYDYKEVYGEDDFPMVEMNNNLYQELVSMFGEKIIESKLLDWINRTYNLDAKQILPD